MDTANLQLQDQLKNAMEKMETISAQNLESHARIEEHGVRLNSTRLKIDGHEHAQRALGDRLQRTEGKVEEIKVMLSEKTRSLDVVSGLSQKADAVDKLLDSTREQVQDLYQHIFGS